MKRILLALTGMLLLVVACYGQYNEKQIMVQQAYQLLAQRQYAQAEQLFLQVLDKYPSDFDSIVQLFNIYIGLAQADKAESLMQKYQRGIPPQMLSEQRVQLLLLKGQIDDAWKECMAYTELYANEGAYRLMASYFERKGLFDKSLDLYKSARQKMGRPDLFQMEIANAGLNIRQFDLAISEYLTYLIRNPGNQYFVNNQLKTILQEDSTRIDAIGAIADTCKTNAVKEVYATSLLNINQPQRALEIMKQLGLPNLRVFADNQAAAGNDAIAYDAYAYAATLVNDPINQGFPTRMMQIKYDQGDYQTAAVIGLEAISKADRLRTKSYALVEIYRLMAKVKLALGEPADSAMVWLDKALAINPDLVTRAGVSIDIARLRILSSQYKAAEQNLKKVDLQQYLPQRDYLYFLSALLSGQVSYADSLMHDYLIRYPGSPEANDAMYLMMLTLSLKGGAQTSFFNAFKLLQLNQSPGLDSLIVVMEQSKDEEFRLLAVEWALRLDRNPMAKELLNYTFTDPVTGEYAEYLRLLLSSDKQEEQNLAREFLKNKPNSIYAPDVRQRISRWAAQRPSL